MNFDDHAQIASLNRAHAIKELKLRVRLVPAGGTYRQALPAVELVKAGADQVRMEIVIDAFYAGADLNDLAAALGISRTELDHNYLRNLHRQPHSAPSASSRIRHRAAQRSTLAARNESALSRPNALQQLITHVYDIGYAEGYADMLAIVKDIETAVEWVRQAIVLEAVTAGNDVNTVAAALGITGDALIRRYMRPIR
ncbi:hypothetical protein [Gordonia sihwensis]|uniref:hypothetical protein n=1 Tax=Gordonia sihwensis TaxID=173559 RepID=UPI0005EE95E9|nr:hypothetical protein [Gordonia sihwensis]KJR10447.1 hypothetical protein UG54_00130 [Gordonia sihwensis]